MTQYIDTGVPIGDRAARSAAFCDPTLRTYVPPVYGFKVYDGDMLIHDFERCRSPEGVDGMYDHMDGKFWPEEECVPMVLNFFKNADKVWVRYGGDGNG